MTTIDIQSRQQLSTRALHNDPHAERTRLIARVCAQARQRPLTASALTAATNAVVRNLLQR